MKICTFSIIAFLVLTSQVNPISCSRQRNYNFNIRYFNATPDGVQKAILGVNGKFPGPTIRVTLGDFLIVRVTNSIQSRDNTSIHWHGLEQYLSPFQDGPEQVTQCPIVYGSTQTYQFQVNQAGTYWWHSHHSYQYTEGCWGVFIVDNPREVHASLYDEELTLTLNDWYHIPGKDLTNWYLSKESHGNPPIPDSALLNGVGRYNCSFATPQGHSCSSAGQRYPVFELKRGSRYRVRVINTSAIVAFFFSIDNHSLSTIEVDGVDTVVVNPVDQALLAPAQRYSFIVRMGQSSQVQFWIRATVQGAFNFTPNINPYPVAFQKNILGILRYTEDLGNEADLKPGSGTNEIYVNGSSEKPQEIKPSVSQEGINPPTPSQGRPAQHGDLRTAQFPLRTPASRTDIQLISTHRFNQPIQYEPITSRNLPKTQPPPRPIILNQTDCRPYGIDLAPGHFDQNIILNIEFKNISKGLIRGNINHIVYQVGVKPVLFEIIHRNRIPRTSHAINTKYGIGKVIQLVINSREFRPHPFHLHGHSFYVLGTGVTGDGDYNEVRDGSKLRLNGVRRDTILVPTTSWAVLRYWADNPGVWLFHCHNNWHFQAGLGLVFIEGGPALVSNTYGTRLNGSEGIGVCKRAGVY